MYMFLQTCFKKLSVKLCIKKKELYVGIFLKSNTHYHICKRYYITDINQYVNSNEVSHISDERMGIDVVSMCQHKNDFSRTNDVDIMG